MIRMNSSYFSITDEESSVDNNFKLVVLHDRGIFTVGAVLSSWQELPVMKNERIGTRLKHS